MQTSIAARRGAHSVAFSLRCLRAARALGVFVLGAVLLAPLSAIAASTTVVISQVYGGGGNTGATYKNDFIELFNRGTTAVSLNGWSVQYAAAAGTSWAPTSLTNVTLQPGQYYLIQGAAGTGGTTNLPTPDATGAPNLSGSAGKVALVNTTTALTGACPTSSTIVDFVGYGTTATCSEPTSSFAAANNAPAPASGNLAGDLRALAGCTDTDNNAADFTSATAAPRNTQTTLNPCSGSGGSTNPSGAGAANPSSLQASATTLLTVAVTQGTNPASAIQSVTADLSSIGGSATQTLYDDGTHGDAQSGDGTYSFSATIGASTTSGSKTLPVTITDGVPRTGTASIALTVTSPPLTIMAIQGHGAASSYAGQTVTSAGNVVTAVGPKGFFMQDPAGDGDVSTSDGIYVYLGTAPSVTVGDVVTVTGQVQEFNGSSEIAASPSVTKTGTGTVPAAIELNPSTSPTSGICLGGNSTINPPVDGYQAANFACLDGMLVKMSDGVVTGATMGTGADGVHSGTPSGFYATIGSAARPFREIGAQYPGLNISGKSIPVFDGDPEIVEIYFGGLGFNGSGFALNAGQHFQVTGIIQGYQGSYEIYPQTLSTSGTAPTYPIAVPDPVAGTLTIGTQNMLHFFNSTYDGGNDSSQYTDTCGGSGNTTGTGGTGASDTCPTLAEYQIRLKKMSLQIRTVLKAPVVQAVQEVENYSVLTDLANQIHADDSTLTYVPYTIAGNDPGGINIGVLVRSDVVVNSVTQLYKGFLTSACSSGTSCLLNDRPPVLLDAVYNGYRFRVLLIYDRSLINLGVNDYVGQKRLAEAVQVSTIVQTLQTTGATLAGAGNAQQSADGTVTSGSFDITGDATIPLTILGDFNAYEFTDGYVDVTGMILGTAVENQNQYWDNTYVPPSPVLFDTGSAATPANHYSYNFDGYAQEIDHILLSQRGQQDFIAIGNAHGNSDVSEAGPDVLDATTARRTSDHDGQVVTLGYVVTPSAGANGSISASTVQTVSKNATPTFTVTPAPGYAASVGGSCGGSLSGNTYTTAAVTANCTVVATFSAVTSYTVTATTDSNGSANPASQSVNSGSTAAVTLTPNTGYHIEGITSSCGGALSGNVFTTAAVTADCAITASFGPDSFTVTASSDANGSISPLSQSVNYGTTAAFTLTPNTGYSIGTVSSTCGGSLSGNVYTTAAITGDCSVSASFTSVNYTVTASTASAFGSVAPASQNVASGATASLTITPNPGFSPSVSGDTCTATKTSGTTWTTGAITSNCALSVDFKPGFVALSPARLLDTRAGATTTDGQFAGIGTQSGGATINLNVLGRGGVPASAVAAVVLNVTAVGPAKAGFVTVWPSGAAQPVTSNLNFAAAETRSNLVTVKVGTNGQVALFTSLSTGSANLIADVAGYFTSTSDFNPLVPARLLDTRPGATTTDGQSAGGGPLGPQAKLDLAVASRGGVSDSAGIAVLNVTATGPTAAAFATVWPSDQTRPLTSNLNFVAGQTASNLVISNLSADGDVSIFNQAGQTNFVADVMGWFPAVAQLVPVTPARIMDTRSGATTVDGQFAGAGPLAAQSSVDLTVTGRGNVAASNVGAVILNVTVITPSTAGFLTVWPSGGMRPLASSVNYAAGKTTPNLVIAKVGSNGKVSIFSSNGAPNVVVDVVGYFSGTP